MSTKLFVGNISWNLTNEQLEEMFSSVGTVTDAFILTDRETKRSRGFGFVTFETEEDAQKAIDEFNGKEVEGRELVVNVARERD